MKPLVLLLTLLFAPIVLSAQSFTIAITPPAQTITVGETATYSIIITPENGYSASVFLSVVKNGFGGTAVLSNAAPNPPYSNITLTVRPTVFDTGTRTITITGKNAGLSNSASCTVTSLKNVLWTTMQFPVRKASGGLSNDSEGNISFISYQPSDHTNKGDTLYTSIYMNQQWETTSFCPQLYTLGKNEFGQDIGPFEYVADKDGVYWFLTEKGIARFDGKFLTLFNKSNTQEIGIIQAVRLDRNGIPVFLSLKGGIYSFVRYDGTNWNSINIKQPYPLDASHPRPVNFAATFCIDSSNNFWIPLLDVPGIVHIQDTVQQLFDSTSNPPLTIGNVTEILCDKTGRIWNRALQISNGIALSYLDGAEWKNITSPTNTYLTTLVVDDSSNAWVGSQEGLHKYDFNRMSWTNYNVTNSPLSAQVVQLAKDRNQNIWMISGSLFYIFNPNGLVNIPLAPTAVEEQPLEPESGITLSPNPSTNSFSVSGLHDVRSLRMANSFGMEVLVQDVVGDNTTVDVSSLASGMYFVQFRSATGTVVKPLVVNH